MRGARFHCHALPDHADSYSCFPGGKLTPASSHGVGNVGATRERGLSSQAHKQVDNFGTCSMRSGRGCQLVYDYTIITKLFILK